VAAVSDHGHTTTGDTFLSGTCVRVGPVGGLHVVGGGWGMARGCVTATRRSLGTHAAAATYKPVSNCKVHIVRLYTRLYTNFPGNHFHLASTPRRYALWCKATGC